MDRGSSITPGVDDTPYIWFAIDQLTRDEEVRGSRADPMPQPMSSADDYPVERIAANPMMSPDGDSSPPSPSFLQQQRARHSGDLRELRYARGSRDMHGSRDLGELRAAFDLRTGRDPLHTGFDVISSHDIRDSPDLADMQEPATARAPRNSQQQPKNRRDVRESQVAHDNRDSRDSRDIRNVPVAHGARDSRDGRERAWLRDSLRPDGMYNIKHQCDNQPLIKYTTVSDVFVPFQPAYSDRYAYTPLRFLPAILRPMWMGLYILFLLVILALLLFSVIWSPDNSGLWTYVAFGDARYFVFQYLPTMIGMIALVWLMQIHTALKRMAPFLALASGSTHARNQAVFLDYYPTQFLVPNLQYFRAGQGALGSIFFVFWVFNFTIPLLASAFTVRFFGEPDAGRWRWFAVKGVVWATIALYFILIASLVALVWRIWHVPTGLRWDPRSLADLIAMYERSNIMNDYSGTEIFVTKRDFNYRLASRTDRLGYWHTASRPRDVFYGMGEEGGITRRYSIEQGRIREKASEKVYHDPTVDIEAGGTRATWKDMRSDTVRRRYLPWFMRTTWVVLWAILAAVLFIAFILVSFLNRAVLKGFSPELRVSATEDGFSAANFLYSFIPTFLALILFLLFQCADLAIRRLIPFSEMSMEGGAAGERSLLLDYPFRFPVSITLTAIINSHYRLAFISLVSLASAAIPIIAGGMFWAQWYVDAQVARVAAHPSALYALCFFLSLYLLAVFAIIPGRRNMGLPHDALTLAELTSWIYMSNLLHDRQFMRAGGATKAELVARLLGTEVASNRGFLMSLASLTSWGSWAGITTGVRTRITGGDMPGDGKGAEPYRYGFGVFVGRDGKEHLGIDRVARGQGRMII